MRQYAFLCSIYAMVAWTLYCGVDLFLTLQDTDGLVKEMDNVFSQVTQTHADPATPEPSRFNEGRPAIESAVRALFAVYWVIPMLVLGAITLSTRPARGRG